MSRPAPHRPVRLALLAIIVAATPMIAQQPDTLRLGPLQRAAERSDSRAGQGDLLKAQSTLRQQSLRTDQLPSFSLQGQAQHLSDVTSFTSTAGSPFSVPQPYKDQFDASLNIRKKLIDPSAGDRLQVELAQLAEGEARVHAVLWQQRQQVNDAFFAMLRLDAQGASLDAALIDLVGQRRLANERVTNGTALPSEVLLLDAEIAKRRQNRDEIYADRGAMRTMLESLTGQSIAPDAVLEVPDLAADVATVRSILDQDHSRPEFAVFAASDTLIQRRIAAADDLMKPRLSVFARGGYGRPGLNQLSRDFNSYYLAGLQLEWAPWNWGTTHRDQEVQVLQSRILQTEKAAFSEGIRRATIRDLATIDQLLRSLATDDTIIALRERVLNETRLRVGEGVTTSAEFIDRETDLLLSRLDRDAHRVRLVEARARVLTTVGHEVR